MKTKVPFYLKLVVTVSLCAYIAAKVDWHLFWAIVVRANVYLLLLVIGFRFLGVLISAAKWQQVLSVVGIRFSLWQLQCWYLAASFLNNFLPTSIGGDAYRVLKTANNPKGGWHAFSAVLGERIIGLAALLALGLTGALLTYRRNQDELSLAVAAFTLSVLVIGGLLIFILKVTSIGEALARPWPASVKITAGLAAIKKYRFTSPSAFLAIGLSLLFHIQRIFSFWLILLALGVKIDFAQLTVALAVSDVTGLVPISLNGLGVIEGAFIFVMQHYGITPEIALSTMLLARVLLLPVTLVGGLAYLTGCNRGQTSERTS